MWMETKTEEEETRIGHASLSRRALKGLRLFTGDMKHLDEYMQDKYFVLQLAIWGLRGVTRVILANNPLSGALIMAALCWQSPWQGLLGSLGVLASTLTAVIMGQDSVFLYSGLSSLLDHWDLPVSVFPFNTIILLYLLCTGSDHPYFPHHPAIPPRALVPNDTKLNAVEVIRGIPLGVGQIFVCGALGPSLLILGAVLLYSPLLAIHALLGSAVGTLAAMSHTRQTHTNAYAICKHMQKLAGLSMAVNHGYLYSGLSGFNGALACMTIGGLCFTFNWKTHLFAIASAFISAYVGIALGNLLGTVGLPVSSWAATLTTTLMLLLTGSLAAYRIPTAQVMAPEHNLRSHRHCDAGRTREKESTDV
ncbi:Urea transporter 1 Solute carrier family 14 member 1 Urea transporter, erythrocyte [Channa argus]|uniref:Urea transporter n=1 Tax=Channa argus TaxID=215402 RepID=A0A6G1Q599_CHAAH|nr:Urea transporter 1 Solute carrier family 14 member 1 Urea transporter, erythrocyte [Channa argus]